MKTKRVGEDAVSPVVGVMLMLVVTIIIGAIVSGFAGGLASESQKTPQLNIRAEYSQSQGMSIYHLGGDTVNTLDTQIFVRNTRDFGADFGVWAVNTTVVKINNVPWFNPTGWQSSSARTFSAGEVAIVSPDDLGQVQPYTYGGTGSQLPSVGMGGDSGVSNFGYLHASALNKRFLLTLVDAGGRTVAKTEVTVRA
ncbi:MAG: type IV pilin N-terminal domain-containing protein [Methanocalculus sp.]|uniref:type IV pilin N-terminal domain-containing protein n=1 Tax=Methanocalculus sp. TaxID=2004547 RepID=UPI0027174AFC|nr:type IV pilin N-terminal domain-containing protein [Methanocalculus sp.]MDO9540217.1 type IV pilin N-terminal domain-containing protein [Methanocalculus sp.]